MGAIDPFQMKVRREGAVRSVSTKTMMIYQWVDCTFQLLDAMKLAQNHTKACLQDYPYEEPKDKMKG